MATLNFPADKSEYNAPNGITYTWDTLEEKWRVKSYGTEQDPRYVKRQGGDDMEGPLIMTGPRNAGDDPLLPGNVSSIQTLNVDNTQNSGLQLRHNGNARVYVGDSDVAFAADIKFNRNVPTVIKNNTQDLLSFDGSEVAYLGEIIEDEDIVNKKYVEDITGQLQQDIISLDEEIESIAKSMEKGFWHYEEPSGGPTRAPGEGRFFLLKNFNSELGVLGAEFTQEYSEAEAVVLHNNEWNREELDGSGGATHTWSDVAVNELIDLLDRPDPDFLFGKITFVDAGIHADAVVIGFDKIEFDGSPTNHESGLHETLLKIFKEPSGGEASEFVKKSGNANGIMTGDLTLSTTNDASTYDSTAVDAKLVFKNKKSDGNTSYINLYKNGAGSVLTCDENFYTKGNLNLGVGKKLQSISSTGETTTGSITFDSSWMVLKWNGNDRLAVQTEGGNLKYDGKKQLNWNTNGGSLQHNNNNVLEWNSARVTLPKVPGHNTNVTGFTIKGSTSTAYGSSVSNNNGDLLKVEHVASYADRVQYFGRITANNDIATKKYVDDNKGISGTFVKTPSADATANTPIEIYRSGNNYYIKGGAA